MCTRWVPSPLPRHVPGRFPFHHHTTHSKWVPLLPALNMYQVPKTFRGVHQHITCTRWIPLPPTHVPDGFPSHQHITFTTGARQTGLPMALDAHPDMQQVPDRLAYQWPWTPTLTYNRYQTDRLTNGPGCPP